MREKVRVSTLGALYSDYMDAFHDVEAYLPPDESDSWPDSASELIEERDRLYNLLSSAVASAENYGLFMDI